MKLRTGLTFDPLDKYRKYDNLEILETCGFLPQWALDPSLFGKGIIEAMTESYRCGELLPLEQATVDEQGVMHYPGDPDQYPLLKIERGEEVMYQYLYGLVAFVTPTGTLVTRMD